VWSSKKTSRKEGRIGEEFDNKRTRLPLNQFRAARPKEKGRKLLWGGSDGQKKALTLKGENKFHTAPRGNTRRLPIRKQLASRGPEQDPMKEKKGDV